MVSVDILINLLSAALFIQPHWMFDKRVLLAFFLIWQTVEKKKDKIDFVPLPAHVPFKKKKEKKLQLLSFYLPPASLHFYS